MTTHQDPPMADDAFQAIGIVSPWVNNADTKLGLLATATTILATAVLRERRDVDMVLHQSLQVRGGLALACYFACAIAITVAGLALFWGLIPRLTNPQPSRFAFPHLAQLDDIDSLVNADPAALRTDAWLQAQTLAKIVRKKYRCVRVGLIAGTLAGVAFVGWLLVAPPLHP
jgi:hypothetical protein